MLRVGIIGTGPFCRSTHLLSLMGHTDAAITALYNRGAHNRSEALAMLAQAGIHPQIYDDPYSLCTADAVDAVLLCVPPDLFPSLVSASVTAGKHVFCEKPIAVTIHGARRVADAARTACHTVFHTGFVIRHSYVAHSLMQAIGAGRIGTPQLVWCRCYNDSNWPYREDSWVARRATSGGLLNSWAVHPLDLLNAMAGSNPQICSGFGGHFVKPNTDNLDAAYVSIQYENGVIGSLQLCRFAPRGDDWMIGCIGIKGMIEAGFFGRSLTLRTHYSDTVEQIAIPPYPHHSYDGMQQQMDSFIHACTSGTQTATGYEAGYYATALALAAEQSIAEHTVQDIPQLYRE